MSSGKKCPQQGFSLIEMLLALLICSLLFLSAARFFPWLLNNSARLQQQIVRTQEVRQLLLTLEKYLRRAGYCEQPPCVGPALSISPTGECLLVRLQSRRYVAGGVSGPLINDSYGFRLNNGQIEVRRGADSCVGQGWESLTDPQRLPITALRFQRQGNLLGVEIGTANDDKLSFAESYWIRGENL
ncbi:prepilin peptidase-dependent protein [Tatumella saanichensis]|uniref:prepilin peptidase-dependent protein n=1 Tax=Tatumella saanichensis TaxID=480813 RepID=UPI0004B5D0F2|nr:prepilin peptidase-dependent protein [Tatumella saanichensis]